jgi:hypothetical protein
MPLSLETAKVLDQVKKTGNPCKFVMVTKGAAVLSVVAYRKGSEDTRIREAKDAGNGAVSCGVVDYAGNLSFKLLRSDGYEKPPVTNTKLKDFLNDGTELKAKPTIDIVDQLPNAVMESDGQPQDGQARGGQQTGGQQTGGQQTGGQQPGGQYRSSDDWKPILAKIQSAPDLVTRMQLLTAAAQEVRAERDRARQELDTNPQSKPASEAAKTLVKVAEILKRLQPSLPQSPDTPHQQKLKALQTERQSIDNDVRTKTDRIKQPMHILDQTGIDALLQECETDANSDFGQVLALLDLKLQKPGTRKNDPPKESTATTGRLVDETMTRLIAAKQKATEYIKEHKDPRIGSLPSRVKKRRQYCEQFVKQIDGFIVAIGEKNQAATELCQEALKKVGGGQYLSPDVAGELQALLSQPLLTDETKAEIRRTIPQLSAGLQQMGYDLIARSKNLTDKDRLEIMEAHGCGSKPGGGTSDVKLLKSKQDGDIEYAIKSAAKESEQALFELGLPNGACAIREDLSSAMFQKFKELTNIDLGFPKSELTRINGQPYAVIEGIKGKMADREALGDIQKEIDATTSLRELLVNRQRPQEEIQPLDDALNKLQAKQTSAQQDCENVPDQVSSQSMTKVLVSSMLTGQWDCKWGNLIVEGQTARPIDAGASLPTLKTLDGFLNPSHNDVFGIPAFEQLLAYPAGHSKAYQDLPIASQNMDQGMVQALLGLNPDALINTAKSRRDEVMREQPNLGGGVPLVDDTSLEISKASTTAIQQILRNKQPITLKEFAVAYGEWFKTWAPTFYQSKAQ